LKKAFISAEDKNFYTHGGIDLTGIARAVIMNIQNIGKGRRPMGASTITQQVAKNFFLSSERSLSRKIKEALLARRMEGAFTKDHILELYLNEIYLGQGSYGVASASMAYFNKAMNELTLDEMAFLAALPKAPNNYHPIRKAEAAKNRRDWVLSRMADDGYITPDEARQAMDVPVHMNPGKTQNFAEGQYFAEEVRRFVVDKYGDESINLGGLTIRTSLKPDLQKYATTALQDGLIAYDQRHGWRGPVDHTDSDVLTKLAEYKKAYAPKNWQYAGVISVMDTGAEIILMDESKGYIPLEKMTWAKKALENNRISSQKVERATDVLNVGDIVLVAKEKDA